MQLNSTLGKSTEADIVGAALHRKTAQQRIPLASHAAHKICKKKGVEIVTLLCSKWQYSRIDVTGLSCESRHCTTYSKPPPQPIEVVATLVVNATIFPE